MRTIIAGSRGIISLETVFEAIEKSCFEVTTVISGGAKGVDVLGETWGAANNVPVEIYKADWGAHGKSAGPIRNVKMAEVAEALIAVWDGESKGTKHMIDVARAKGLKVYIYLLVPDVPEKRES